MAKKEKKEKVDKAEKGGKSNLIIIVLLLLILIGLGSFAGFYFYNKSKEKSPTAQTQVVAKVEEAYVDLGEYTLNLSDTDSKRYIKAKISIGYDKTNKKLAEEATADAVALRSTGLEFLQSKKADDFKAENLDKVKKELIDNLNKDVTKGQFTGVYFQDLIVQ